MKEAGQESSPKPQELDRRTFLRKAVGITAGALLASRFSETTRAQQPESTLSDDELGYIENLEDTVVEPMDPDLYYRPISPIASIELNTENNPDAQAKANLLNFNFSNLIYRNQDLYLQGLEESLINGEVPEEDVSGSLVKELEENPDFRLNINGLDASSGLMELVPTSFDPRNGLSIHATNYDGVFRINDPSADYQLYGFTPWVEGGKLHLNLYVFDQEYKGANPEIKNRRVSSEYNYLVNLAMEFMVLTGGNQYLWDTYCLPLESKIVEERRERSGIMFDSVGSIALDSKAGGMLDVKLANR